MSPLLQTLRKAMPSIFWLGFTVTMIVTLMPSHKIHYAFIFWDKAQHALAFFMLMFTGCVAYSKHAWYIFVGLVLYGAGIEVMQEFFTTTRNGDIYDIYADTVGVFIGWCFFLVVYKFTHKPSV
jgi:VanZ family protein